MSDLLLSIRGFGEEIIKMKQESLWEALKAGFPVPGIGFGSAYLRQVGCLRVSASTFG